MAINPGMTLGQYQIVDQLGRGGMAVVYKAYQPSLDRHVAVKVLPAFYSDDASFVDRFRTEAVAVAQLRHPNILTIYDFGQHDGIYYIVMEYVAGGTLQERLGKALPAGEAYALLRPIASALDYAHSRNMLHRDIKPSNVLLGADSTPILADFGLAKMMEGTARLTRTGLTVGTPEYMSPEQATGKAAGPSSDLYSLGVVLYEMLTGRVPFTADTPVAVVLSHLSDPPPSPRSLNPDLSEGVERALLRGLAKQAEERYGRAVEMLDTVLEAAGGSAPSTGATPRPIPVVQPPPTPAAASAAAEPSGAPKLGELEFQDVWVDLMGHNLPFNPEGWQRAAEVLTRRVAALQAEGWELIGTLRDPAIYTQARSLRGAVIRGASVPLRRVASRS